MSIKSELFKLKIKNKSLDVWYGFWRLIGNLLSKPYNYIHDRNVKKWSNPSNYNKMRLLKIIKKEITKRLVWGDIYLLDSNDKYHDIDNANQLDLPYDFIKYSKNKYMEKYRQYAYKNDKHMNWCEFIIKNLDNVEIECILGEDIITQWSYDYNKYKDKHVYIIKLLNNGGQNE